jgi:hypothetical protein
VAPIKLPEEENFRTYKEKVVYILQSFNENLENPKELNWCLNVIKNDFLQISNSMPSSTRQNTQAKKRRFSKTQQRSTQNLLVQE